LSFSGPENSSAIACLYNADRKVGKDQLLFAINPHLEPAMIPLPLHCSGKGWVQIADQERVNRAGLEGARLRIGAEGIYLPAMSCGLWRT
ncbi:MAG: alpha-amylase family glycosyl hydrolase, partial [Puniceicoccales bacterium]